MIISLGEEGADKGIEGFPLTTEAGDFRLSFSEGCLCIFEFDEAAFEIRNLLSEGVTAGFCGC